MVTRYLRSVLYVIGLSCLVVFFSVANEYRWGPEGEHSRWTIGLNVSPWYVWEHSPGHFNAGIQLPSWSWLFAAAGIGAFRWRGHLKASLEPSAGPGGTAG